MNYKIFVFSNDALKSIDISYKCLQKTLASFNVSIDLFAILQNNQENFSKVLEQNGNLILFCKNEDIDKIMIDNISKLSNDKHFIDDQAVIFNKSGNKILFVPYDSDWLALLKKAKLNDKMANKTCEFKLFGLSKQKVEEMLSSLSGQIENFQYSIFEENLLVDIFASYTGKEDLIDNVQVKIANLFTNFIYSENSFGLSQTICQLARLKDLKLTVCEGVTSGAVLKELCSKNENIKEILQSGKVEFINKSLTPENVYQQTIGMFLTGQDNVFAINIQGEYENGVLTCLYTLGTANNLDVYKNTFKTDKDKALNIAVNAIMFNIVKKLRQNNLII